MCLWPRFSTFFVTTLVHNLHKYMVLGEDFCTNPDNGFPDDTIEECAGNIATFMPVALKYIGERLITFNDVVCNNWYDGICSAN